MSRQLPSSLPALHQCKYNWADVQHAATALRGEQIIVKSLCGELSPYYTCVQYMCSYICMQAQSFDIFGGTRTRHKLDHTCSNTNTTCPWFPNKILPILLQQAAYQISVWAEWKHHTTAGRIQHISIMSVETKGEIWTYFYYLTDNFSPPAQLRCFSVLKSGARDK